MGVEIKSPLRNHPYCSQIYGQIYNVFFSALYPNEANKTGYGQVYIFNYSETKTKPRVSN
jgi:hypothetical protein